MAQSYTRTHTPRHDTGSNGCRGRLAWGGESTGTTKHALFEPQALRLGLHIFGQAPSSDWWVWVTYLADADGDVGRWVGVCVCVCERYGGMMMGGHVTHPLVHAYVVHTYCMYIRKSLHRGWEVRVVYAVRPIMCLIVVVEWET